MISVLRASILCLLSAALSPAYVGQWHSYTNKTRVTSLIAHGGYVYAGTQGGVRRVQPATLAQKEYGNLDGLVDCWVVSLAEDGDGALWAAGHDGYLYTLTGDAWEATGRSYASLGWEMNDRALLASGHYLYLGSIKGLAVFDTRQRVSQINLTRFGSDIDVSVLSLLRRGDTLYAGTSAGVYKAFVNFADPLNPPAGAGNLADPSQWIKVNLPVDPDRKYDALAFIGDSLATFGPGTLVQSPIHVEAFSGSPLVIGSQTYPAWNDFDAAVFAGGKVFAGGRSGLAVSANPSGATADAALLAPLTRVPTDTLAAIGVNNGAVWAQASSGMYRLAIDSGNFNFAPSSVEAPSPELYYRFLRTIAVDTNADPYVASWGGGLVRLHNGANTVWNTLTDPCLFGLPPSSWTVIHSVARPRGNDLFFALLTAAEATTHEIAHLNIATGQVSCLTSDAPGTLAHGIQALSDTLLGVATDRGLALFKIREGAGAPLLESKGLWTSDGSANEAWDLAADHWGRVWTLIGTDLAYLDSLDQSTTQKLKTPDGFTGTNCKSLESDPAGILWAGCDNGLFRIQTGPNGEIAGLQRFGMDDGLLSTFIYDVSVDPATGRVWIATDRGVSMLEGSSQPALASGDLAAVVPYPNPFRPQHRFVIFDHLPSNSTLRLYTGNGDVVRIFQPSDLKGNQAQWDGKNESGRPVSPGVYLFSIVSGSKVQRGKIIVAR